MRLHRLTLTAIGPFATEQVVDFDQLGASGLFLLDGPTGAGKTTVLDAITFALYGPTANNGDGRLHSDFAERTVTPTVSLEFSLGGRRHRITRTPAHERPKRKGDGMTPVATTAHLERFEGGVWVSRSSNKAEVGEMLTEALGLSRDQFTQVVLLPQGQFATFLRASDDDRRTLLTRLFGTQLYDRITDELDRRRQSAAKELETAEQRVRSCVAAAAEAAGLDAESGDELAGLRADERADRVAELSRRLAARHTEALELARVAADECATARAALASAEADADRLHRYRAHLAARAAHEQGRDAHDAAVRVLDDARRAEPVSALLRALTDARAAVAPARAEVARHPGLATEQHLRGEGADTLADRSVVATAAAAELQHLVDEEAGLDALRSLVEQATIARGGAVDRAAALDARLAGLPAELAVAEAEALQLRDAAGAGSAATAERDRLARRLTAARALADLAPRLAVARQARSAAVDAHQAAVDDHQRLVEARLSGMAAELAEALVDGTPCAVCGSLEHPAPARAAADSVSAADLDDAEAARAEAEVARSRADAAVADLERELAGHEAVADGADVAALQAAMAAASSAVAEAEAAAAELPLVTAGLAALRAEAEQLAAAHTDAVQARATAESQLDAVRLRFDELSAALADAAAGHASVAERQQALRVEAEGCAALATAVRALAAALAAESDAAERAAREAEAAGFGSLDDLARAVLAAADRAALQAGVDEWQEQAGRLSAALEATEFAGLDPAGSSTPGVAPGDDAVAAARAHLRSGEQRAALADRAAELARHAADRFTACAATLAAAEQQLTALRVEVEPVMYLSRLAKGTAGQRKVALTTYVLRHWFEQVVAAANVRLGSISAGRYELIRVDEAATARERAGLTLQVIDRHTGEARSPKSLSGGETFYTSLALALGLADVVKAEAGGVDLDTLFIDEGFGTLDADTLDQVMAVIDDLRDRGRVVGIVSHIADLKERIPERLEVRRLHDGSSALRVVA